MRSIAWILSAYLLLFYYADASTECKDLVKHCSRAEKYCKTRSETLKKTLEENCKLTCGHCTKGSKNDPKNNKPKNNKPKNKPHPPAEKLPKYKLHYFAFRLRGEPVRLMFTYKNIKFEDFQIDLKDWPKLKPNYPNGQVPMLEIDNKKISQSMAIYRYVGNKLGLFGKDDVERAFLDSIGELFKECFDKITPYIQAMNGVLKVDAAGKQKLHDEVFVPALDKYAPQVEAVIKESKSGFIGESGISWVDFYIAGGVRTFNNFDATTMAKFPTLMEHNKRMYELKELQPYFAKHKPGPF